MNCKKPQLILDLDSTLICSLDKNELNKIPNKIVNKLKYVDMSGLYRVFMRPYLDLFLDYVFANWDVSVWTAADRKYAMFIIRNCILTKPGRKIKYVFDGQTTDLSLAYYSTVKDLRLLRENFKLHDLSPNRTLIIDDLLEVAKANGKQGIKCPEFELVTKHGKFRHECINDTFLLSIINLLKQYKKTMC